MLGHALRSLRIVIAYGVCRNSLTGPASLRISRSTRSRRMTSTASGPSSPEQKTPTSPCGSNVWSSSINTVPDISSMVEAALSLLGSMRYFIAASRRALASLSSSCCISLASLERLRERLRTAVSAAPRESALPSLSSVPAKPKRVAKLSRASVKKKSGTPMLVRPRARISARTPDPRPISGTFLLRSSEAMCRRKSSSRT